MVLVGLQTSWGPVVIHLVSVGFVLLAFARTWAGGGGIYLGAVNGIGRRRGQWLGQDQGGPTGISRKTHSLLKQTL